MESTYKDFRIQSRNHQFKMERENQKRNYQAACKQARNDANAKIKALKETFEADCERINAIADSQCDIAREKYDEQIAAIAAREDDFKKEVAEYISSLPKSETAIP